MPAAAGRREPLRLAGESLCEVRPLAEPDAVRLFAERARDARPDFAVDDTSRAAVVEICRRLDGLPLAIELAAARLRSLPVQELAGRLADRFGVLTRGGRTSHQRHRTLRDVVAWSWDLLTGDERELLQRLAVVPVITSEAAARVGGPAAADLLASLVDKSLLQLADGGEPRYRMLETIREYARQRLTEAGRLADAVAALVDHATELAERAEPHLRTPDQVPWLLRLRAERENLHAALRATGEAGDSAATARLAAALGQFWTMEADQAQAARRLRRALDVPGPCDPQRRAVVIAYYVFNAMLAGENPGALEIADRLRGWAAESGEADRADGHPALVLLDPLLALLTDDVESGITVTDRLLATDDAWTRGCLLLIRSMLEGSRGDMARVCDDLAAAATAFGAAGERWGRMTSLTFLALMRTMFGDESAAPALEEAIELRRRLDPDDLAVEQRAWLAQLHAWTGRVEEARAELTELVRPVAGTSVRCVVLAQVLLGDLARGDGDLAEARRRYEAAADDVRETGESMFVAVLASARAQLAVAEGDADGAAWQLREALGAAVHIKDLPLVAAVGVGAAALQAIDGAPGRAAEALGAAHALRGAADALNPDVIELTTRLRASLGHDGFTTAYDRGRALDAPAAVDLIGVYTRR